jgi:hypothetical protein
MGFLNNTSITVDAVLTKKGRELLARGQDEFKITKFALADDEVDYRLWDTAHPNGSNYYGAVIENMPILESFVDENQIMRFNLVSLPKNTAKLPILEVPSPSLVFNGPGITQTIKPNTRNGSDAEAGYSFVLADATIANLTPIIAVRTTPKETPAQRQRRLRKALPSRGIIDDVMLEEVKRGGAGAFLPRSARTALNLDIIQEEELIAIQNNVGATTPVFTNEEERKRSITLQGHSVELVARDVTSETSTTVTVTGLSTGATHVISVTVKPSPSTL